MKLRERWAPILSHPHRFDGCTKLYGRSVKVSQFSFEPSRWVPLRNTKVLERVRKIRREDIEKHPNPNHVYIKLAHLIKKFRVNCRHLYTFNMDEYADEEGNIAQNSLHGSFGMSGDLAFVPPKATPH
jgi:hypothetical protein